MAVLVGDAEILQEPTDPARVKTYLRKYREGIKDLEMTVAEFTDAFAIPILVNPQTMRGFVE